jgi:hypothetical protein
MSAVETFMYNVDLFNFNATLLNTFKFNHNSSYYYTLFLYNYDTFNVFYHVYTEKKGSSKRELVKNDRNIF